MSTEHYLRFHRRQWILYLMGCAAMAVSTIIIALNPDEKPLGKLSPTGFFFGLMIVLTLIERVRRREEFKRESKLILTDEWLLRGMSRGRGIAMGAMVLAQGPLMFFMAYVPPRPSVFGMGAMTVAVGCGTWAASYLYLTRESR